MSYFINCNKTGFTVLHQNIRSLNCNMDQFEAHLQFFKEYFDILRLTETIKKNSYKLVF